MQTILGAGGVIANDLARTLPRYTDRIRLVSRRPKAINPGDETLSADLTDLQQTRKAVQGSEIVYLTVGLPYEAKVWEEQWPKVMKNTLEACREYGSKLVFFDNMYLYGHLQGPITEETAVNPCSRKGEVRAKISQMVMDASARGEVEALIARAPDFYGPGAVLSIADSMVVQPLSQGKTASWPVNADIKHSFIFTPDAARATALLGNTPDAYQQVWHLPTDPNAITGREFIEGFARAFNVPARFRILPVWMMRLAGLFNSIARESVEMMYQFEEEYLFDSSKFENRFQTKATSYPEGISLTAQASKIKE